jgi:hypothetical protein
VVGTFYLTLLPERNRAAFADRRPATGDPPAHLEPVVHVVLDGQLGPGGFRARGDSAAAREETGFYRDRGFTVFTGAYSRHFFTRHSVPALLSLGRERESAIVSPLPQARSRVVRNPYFTLVRDRGYRIDVYQSDFVDYCRTPGIDVTTCVQVPATSVANIAFLDAGWPAKAGRILEYFLARSSHLVALLPAATRRLDYVRSFAGRGIDLLSGAADDLDRHRDPARFVFVHVLLPHGPYEVDRRCRTRPDPVVPLLFQLPEPASPAVVRRYDAAYREQAACTRTILARLLDRVDAAYGPGRATVIVHGDHGSRDVPVEPGEGRLAGYGPAELAAGFSTLLAVRRPGATGAVIADPVPVQDFLWEFAIADFTGFPSGGWRHFVFAGSNTDTARGPARHLAPSEMTWAGPAP